MPKCALTGTGKTDKIPFLIWFFYFGVMSDEILKLGSLRTISAGDTDYELELIENLTADCEHLMQQMQISLADSNSEHFAEQVHKFKGSSSYLTREPMFSMLDKMDREAHKQGLLPSLEEFQILQTCFEELKDLLEDYKATL